MPRSAGNLYHLSLITDHASSDFPGGANRLDRRASSLVVEFPDATGDADAADALAVEDDRVAAFHRGPALGARGEREPDRMRNVQRLPLRAFRGRRALVGGGADRLG